MYVRKATLVLVTILALDRLKYPLTDSGLSPPSVAALPNLEITVLFLRFVALQRTTHPTPSLDQRILQAV